MLKLFRKLKKYIPFFKAGSINAMAYKFNTFSWFIISLIQFFAVIFLWIAIYKNSENGINSVINGFTFKEIIVYMLFTQIFNFSTFDSQTVETIDDEIHDGTIALSFIKPISYRLRLLATHYGINTFTIVVLGLPCLVIAYVVFFVIGYIPHYNVFQLIHHIFFFILSQILACTIFDTVNYICGILCFYTTAGWGLNQTKEVVVSFLSGSMLPLAFFPGAFGKVIKALPFAGLTQDPVMILLGKFSLQQEFLLVVKNIFWLVILELIGRILFIHASKKLTVQGG